MFGLKQIQIRRAADDLWQGLSDWRLWNLLAYQDVKQRYRRSTLGPIWATLTMGVQILVLGVVFRYVFATTFQRYVPYLCAGIVLWSLFTQIIFEGSTTFTASAGYLLQVRRPLTVYVMQTVWRSLILFAHMFVVYVIVAFIFLVEPSASIVLFPLALFLDIVCLAWMALFAAVISTRYRDMPLIIQSIFSALYWLTPLMYYPEQLREHAYILDYNPFTHMIEIIRDPLMGQTPTLENWLVVVAVAIVGWIGTFLFFARFRARIVYWL